MAAVTKKYTFKNAVISLENGEYTLAELQKDDSILCYNLTNILGEFLDKDGVSLSVGIEGEPEPVDEIGG